MQSHARVDFSPNLLSQVPQGTDSEPRDLRAGLLLRSALRNNPLKGGTEVRLGRGTSWTTTSREALKLQNALD